MCLDPIQANKRPNLRPQTILVGVIGRGDYAKLIIERLLLQHHQVITVNQDVYASVCSYSFSTHARLTLSDSSFAQNFASIRENSLQLQTNLPSFCNVCDIIFVAVGPFSPCEADPGRQHRGSVLRQQRQLLGHGGSEALHRGSLFGGPREQQQGPFPRQGARRALLRLSAVSAAHHAGVVREERAGGAAGRRVAAVGLPANGAGGPGTRDVHGGQQPEHILQDDHERRGERSAEMQQYTIIQQQVLMEVYSTARSLGINDSKLLGDLLSCVNPAMIIERNRSFRSFNRSDQLAMAVPIKSLTDAIKHYL